MTSTASHPVHASWLAALALLGLAGCGQSATNLPKTYAVRGVVLQADDKPASGGNLSFTPKQPGGERFVGVVGSDGKFTARTVGADGATDGAPEGTYTAVFMPAMSSQPTEQHLARPITISEEFTVSATGENNFTIRLPAVGSR